MKYLLITALVMYLLYKVNKFLLKFYFTKFVNQQFPNQSGYQRRKEGDIIVETVQKPNNSKGKSSNDDYVDYEVIK